MARGVVVSSFSLLCNASISAACFAMTLRRDATKMLSSPLWAVRGKKNRHRGLMKSASLPLRASTYPLMKMPNPGPPLFPVGSYLNHSVKIRSANKKSGILTVVCLPEVHESPVEPDLRLAIVHRGKRRIERLRAGSWAWQHPGVRPDEFDSLVFAHAVHPAYENICAQSRKDRVHRHPTFDRARISRP